MSKVILGLICYQGHSSAAALLKDGVLLAASSEERFSRIKEDGTFPKNAIEFVLKKSNLRMEEVDHVAFGWNPFLSIRAHMKNSLKGVNFTLSYIFENRSQAYAKSRMARLLEMLTLRQKLRKNFGYCPPLEYVDHHLAHASSSFFQSGFEDALCFVSDGSGETSSQFACVFKDGFGKTLFETPFPHSLGIFYSAITEYLGFKPEMDEYKVMGLASYGNPEKYISRLRNLISINSSGDIHLDHQYLSVLKGGKKFGTEKLLELIGPIETEVAKSDLAAAAQMVLVECFLHQLAQLKKQHPDMPDKFCGSGGVFLNCVLNQALRKSGIFSEWYFSPISADAGTAVGAAQYLHYKNSGMRPQAVRTLNLGSDFSNTEVAKILRESPYKFFELEDPEFCCAKLLSDSLIVGRFQGRSEFGPRALGHRSILADPRQKEMKQILNEKIKSREAFRPFGPSVLLDKFDDFFISDRESKSFPYMIETVQARPEKTGDIPAVVHIDGSSRVQTVSESENPRYYRMLKIFEDLTGVPMVLNTSFNRNNEPIVNSPSEALDCFSESKLDALVIENYLILAPHLSNQITKYLS